MSEQGSGITIVGGGPITSKELMDEQIEAARYRLKKMREFIAGEMKKGEDYGPPYRGSTRNTILKPGAEKLCGLFRLRPLFEVVNEEVKTFEPGAGRKYDFVRNAGQQNEKRIQGCQDTLIRYIVKCQLIDMAGEKLGEGIGSCNSWEKKYIDRDAFDQDNTLLKMAEKRAYVMATLTATGASRFYTQGAEDEEEHPDIPTSVGKTASSKRAKGKQGPPPESPDEVISPDQSRRLWQNAKAAAEKRGTTKERAEAFLKELITEEGFHLRSQLTVAAYERICRGLEVWGEGKGE